MIIYRVYRSYHDPSESGTYEYGCYSSHALAHARAITIWNQLYPDIEPKIDEFSVGGSVGWEYDYVSISPIGIDKDIDDRNVGYT